MESTSFLRLYSINKIFFNIIGIISLVRLSLLDSENLVKKIVQIYWVCCTGLAWVLLYWCCVCGSIRWYHRPSGRHSHRDPCRYITHMRRGCLFSPCFQCPTYFFLSLFSRILTNLPWKVLAINAPMIYTALCVLFFMRADPLWGQVGGGWALEIESFLGPVKWHRDDRQYHLGPKKVEISRTHSPQSFPSSFLYAGDFNGM